MIRQCMVSETCCATDGQTDRQIDGGYIEVGAPPKKTDQH